MTWEIIKFCINCLNTIAECLVCLSGKFDLIYYNNSKLLYFSKNGTKRSKCLLCSCRIDNENDYNEHDAIENSGYYILS